MNKNLIVVAAVAVLLSGFGLATYLYRAQQGGAAIQPQNPAATGTPAAVDSAVFNRADSPSLGPLMARVQITEFFDPACEACRAFYPYVKQVMDANAGKVRLTLRYATFHKGSDYVAKVLEAARLQGNDIYWKSLEAVLEAQPAWADHHRPQPQTVWTYLKGTGLDIERARREMDDPRIAALLAQDAADLAALNVRQTPSFYINGKVLADFGPEGLAAQVGRELSGASGH